jgi:3-hydroxyisobutyrate dehydrogenase
MATIGFIGLGNMGAPMAANLVKAQQHVTGFDIVAQACAALAEKGGHEAAGIAEAAASGDIVITMLPALTHVHALYLGPHRVHPPPRPEALLLDS